MSSAASDVYKRQLLTFAMSEEEAIEQVSHYKTKYELPTTDLIRFGDSDFIDAIKDAIE